MLSTKVVKGNVSDETIRAHIANACVMDIDAIEAYAIIVFQHDRPGAHTLAITSNLSSDPHSLNGLLSLALKATQKVVKDDTNPEKGDQIHAGLPTSRFTRYRVWRFRHFGF